MRLRAGAKITDELDALLRRGGHKRRFRSFFTGRFLNTANLEKLAMAALLPGPRPIIDVGRLFLIQATGGIPTLMPQDLPAGRLDEFVQGLADRFQQLVDDETAANP
ncbi:hypothetical protein [Couchioplanes azureus]|uniref:hypothetical protein n=1 Tax=Couchioplanes caeruleus TaxID=56438 RepID=UPI0016700880|nr:hypothetical protein [Couchioplanes caeruleus]GGQ85560.1 hypothetical protein GCM10010166_64880 [Couchioplanes caeruleus subsp. azureus]